MTRPANELHRAVAAALPYVLEEPMDIEGALATMERMLRVKAGPDQLEAARDACRYALLSPIGPSPIGSLYAFGCVIIKDFRLSQAEPALALL